MWQGADQYLVMTAIEGISIQQESTIKFSVTDDIMGLHVLMIVNDGDYRSMGTG